MSTASELQRKMKELSDKMSDLDDRKKAVAAARKILASAEDSVALKSKIYQKFSDACSNLQDGLYGTAHLTLLYSDIVGENNSDLFSVRGSGYLDDLDKEIERCKAERQELYNTWLGYSNQYTSALHGA